LIFYKLQWYKTANINVKKLSSLTRGVRAIYHTYKNSTDHFCEDPW